MADCVSELIGLLEKYTSSTFFIFLFLNFIYLFAVYIFIFGIRVVQKLVQRSILNTVSLMVYVFDLSIIYRDFLEIGSLDYGLLS